MTNRPDSHLTFFNGLLWYLEARNWAFGKIKSCPRGSQLFDVRLHHDVYFGNLISAIDQVRDYLKADKSALDAFVGHIVEGLGGAEPYQYVRELRNAIVHRGLDPADTAHADAATLYVLCPASIPNLRGDKRYTCEFRYTIDLAARCNTVTNSAIVGVLDQLGLFSYARHIVVAEDVLASVASSAAVPDWVKAMTMKEFARMDYPTVAIDLARTRVKRMRDLLGQADAMERS